MKKNNKITRNNYEIFFLDYSEGNLSKDDTTALFQFLQENSDLKTEFETFILEETEILQPNRNIVFENAELLKKPPIISVGEINETNYETYFIAFYENDLSEKEQNNLFSFIEQNTFLKTDFELFGKIFLQPNQEIVFPYKKSILQKHNRLFFKTLYGITSIAAIFALFFLFKTVVKPTQYSEKQQFVQINNDSIKNQSIENKNVIESTTVIQKEIAQHAVKDKNSPRGHHKRSTSELVKISQIIPIDCKFVASTPQTISLEYRYEAKQIGEDLEIAKMFQEQQKSIWEESDEVRESSSNFWTSLFYAAEKTAISTGRISNIDNY